MLYENRIEHVKTKTLFPMKQIMILLLLANSLVAQSQRDSTKRVYFSEFQLQPGFNGYQVNQITESEFMQFTPNSELLMGDYSSFDQSHSMQNTTNGYFSILLGLGFKATPNQKFRIGVTSFSTESYSSRYYLAETNTYDTLTSSQTGEQTFIDTTNTTTLEMGQYAQNFTLNADYLFFLRTNKTISFYAGIGIAGGIAFNRNSTVTYSKWSDYYDYEPQAENKDITTQEEYLNSNYFVGSAYIPLGVRLKLGKKNEFWKHVSLAVEYKPLINFSTIVSSRTIVGFGNRFGVGFIVHW